MRHPADTHYIRAETSQPSGTTLDPLVRAAVKSIGPFEHRSLSILITTASPHLGRSSSYETIAARAITFRHCTLFYTLAANRI